MEKMGNSKEKRVPAGPRGSRNCTSLSRHEQHCAGASELNLHPCREDETCILGASEKETGGTQLIYLCKLQQHYKPQLLLVWPRPSGGPRHTCTFAEFPSTGRRDGMQPLRE